MTSHRSVRCTAYFVLGTSYLVHRIPWIHRAVFLSKNSCQNTGATRRTRSERFFTCLSLAVS